MQKNKDTSSSDDDIHAFSLKDYHEAFMEWQKKEITSLGEQKRFYGRFLSGLNLISLGYVLNNLSNSNNSLYFYIPIIFIILSLCCSVKLTLPKYYELEDKIQAKNLYETEYHTIRPLIKKSISFWSLAAIFFILRFDMIYEFIMKCLC